MALVCWLREGDHSARDESWLVEVCCRVMTCWMCFKGIVMIDSAG